MAKKAKNKYNHDTEDVWHRGVRGVDGWVEYIAVCKPNLRSGLAHKSTLE